MTRPRSDARRQLLRAAETLAQGPLGGGHYLELASLAGLPPRRARGFVHNMRAAGELVPVDEVRAAHASRPLVRYAPASAGVQPRRTAPEPDGVTQALRAWYGPGR